MAPTKDQEMAKSYYSIVLDRSAEAVWAVIRPFDHYAWAGVESQTTIEAGKAPDQVAAIRRVVVGDKVLRQILLAHSDIDRSYTYAFCGLPPFPVRNYIATIRVAPVVETDQAFVEWQATFDCAAEEYDRWTNHFEQEGFARWLSALRKFMDDRTFIPYGCLAAAYALDGKTEEANAALAEARRLNPKLTVKRMIAAGPDIPNLLEGLRKAGLPEE
jgi:Polyketide cyclase / dehydrase and lipid transport